MANYRKIWEAAYGPIPKDEHGRSYEIHHIDGNRNNNDLSNLMCVSIEDHYNIHKDKKEYGAAFIIAQRMSLSLDEMKQLTKQMAENKKGKAPWNKGKTGIYSEETINKIKQATSISSKGRTPWNKGKRFKIKSDRSGENNSFYGRSHSEETKQAIRDKLKNRVPWNKGLIKPKF